MDILRTICGALLWVKFAKLGYRANLIYISSLLKKNVKYLYRLIFTCTLNNHQKVLKILSRLEKIIVTIL